MLPAQKVTQCRVASMHLIVVGINSTTINTAATGVALAQETTALQMARWKKNMRAKTQSLEIMRTGLQGDLGEEGMKLWEIRELKEQMFCPHGRHTHWWMMFETAVGVHDSNLWWHFTCFHVVDCHHGRQQSFRTSFVSARAVLVDKNSGMVLNSWIM